MNDEQALIERARSDPDAFLDLYEQFVDRIYAFAYRRTLDEALAKDITSATFEKALRNLHHYQHRNVGFSAWLYRIARNEVANHYRQRLFFVPLPRRYPSALNVEQAVQSDQERSSLHTALIRLSPADRELITLRYLDELSSAEVAAILGCSVNVIYLRLHRALSRLRKHLERLEAGERIYVPK